MPIYDLSYRHWDGALRGAGWRWWVIAEAGIRLLLSYKKFIFLLMLCWIPFFVQAFTVYLTLVKEITMGFSIGPAFFQTAFSVQLVPMVLVAVYAGSGLIASDLAANALPLYFAKPITRLDYVAGKFAIIATFLAGVYMLPVLLLFIFTVGVSPDLTFISENYWVLFSILGYGGLVVSGTALFILALSSTTRSGRIVGVAFIAVAVFSNWMGTLLSIMLGSDQVLAISLWHNLARLSHAFFLEQSNLRLSLWLSVLVLASVAGFSILVLRRRIRPVEIIT